LDKCDKQNRNEKIAKNRMQDKMQTEKYLNKKLLEIINYKVSIISKYIPKNNKMSIALLEHKLNLAGVEIKTSNRKKTN